MNAPAEPRLEARVTPELRQLLVGLRMPRRPTAEPWEVDPPYHGSRGARQHAAPAATAPWKQVSLRRDGALPAMFEGALVLEVRSGQDPEHGYLRLFATADGEAVAHLAYLPPDSLPARPVFRAARVATAEALHRFIDDADPASCLAVCRDTNDLSAHRQACDMLRLPIDIPGLAARESSSVQSSKGMP
jgi:hypothetical protein